MTKQPKGVLMALGMTFGSSVGAVLMAVTGDVWWIPIMLSLGLVTGLLLDQRTSHQPDDPPT